MILWSTFLMLQVTNMLTHVYYYANNFVSFFFLNCVIKIRKKINNSKISYKNVYKFDTYKFL